MKRQLIAAMVCAMLALSGRAGTNFTDVGDVSLQNLAMLNELMNAWSERRQAIGQGPVSAIVSNDIIQDVYISSSKPWQALQQWIIDNCDEFVRVTMPTNDPGNFDGWTSAIPYYVSITQLFADAGADYTNFRRAQEWAPPAAPVWTNAGIMQPNDIYQRWVIDDLQLAFAMLKYTALNNDDDFFPTITGRYESASVSGYSTYTAAVADVTAAFDTTFANWTGTGEGSTYPYYVRVFLNHTGGGWYLAASRYYGLFRTAAIWTGRPSVADWYGRDTGWSGSTFWDFDSLGIVRREWLALESSSASTNSTRDMTQWITSASPTNDPITSCPVPLCPQSETNLGTWLVEFNSGSEWTLATIVRWDFTYDEVP